MTLSANAYGSAAQVAAFVKHLTNGDGAFDAATRPTLAQVEQFLEDRSATLNACLAESGYTIPVTAPATAVTILARYAVAGAAADCELTQRSAGTDGEDENSRHKAFLAEFARACPFIGSGAFAALGAPTARASTAIAGLYVGGKTRGGQNLRPIFGRTSFGNDPTRESPTAEPDYQEP